MKIRKLIKLIPNRPRKWLGYIWDYCNRLIRWAKLLNVVFGVTHEDSFWLYISALSAPFTSLWGIDRWQNPVILRDILVRVEGIGIFEIRAATDDIFHILPFGELDVYKKLQEILKEGDCFVDAGANIGFYSIMAAKIVGDSGKVIAIEMMPETAGILRKHLEYNKVGHVVTVFESALAENSGETVKARYYQGFFGQASIASGINSNGIELSVKTINLDGVCGNIQRIKLLKLDLEGGELGALMGAKKILPIVEHIIFENIFDQSLFRHVEQSGFSVFPMSGKECHAILNT
jgi:FkbM family methyltransferase